MITFGDTFGIRRFVSRIAGSNTFGAVSPCYGKEPHVGGNAQIMALDKKRYHERFIEYQRSLERATSQYSCS